MPLGERLIEPFAGTAVVSMNSRAASGVAADLNHDLISTHLNVRDRLFELLSYCEDLFTPQNNNRNSFEYLRDEFNSIQPSIRKSAIFIYLNRHCFNGLCRYNRKGKFNVPFGRYKSPTLPSEGMVRFSENTKNVEFICSDFRDVFKLAEEGDVIYCDPPYAPIEQTSNFTSYSSSAFGQSEQIELQKLAQNAAERGIPVVISNHDTPFTRELYQDAEQHFFGVKRAISRNASNRGAAAEMIAVFQ
ncbi:Dam family site-specific DNA-(adenine-N6)-methyltransferase [Qipengyuania sp. DSG2-2]